MPRRLRMVGLLPWWMSEARYSSGTNSSKRRRVEAVRGSLGAPLSELKEREGDAMAMAAWASARLEGNDLNSICGVVSDC